MTNYIKNLQGKIPNQQLEREGPEQVQNLTYSSNAELGQALRVVINTLKSKSTQPTPNLQQIRELASTIVGLTDPK